MPPRPQPKEKTPGQQAIEFGEKEAKRLKRARSKSDDSKVTSSEAPMSRDRTKGHFYLRARKQEETLGLAGSYLVWIVERNGPAHSGPLHGVMSKERINRLVGQTGLIVVWEGPE